MSKPGQFFVLGVVGMIVLGSLVGAASALDVSATTSVDRTAVWLAHVTSLPIEATSGRVAALTDLARFIDDRLAEREFELSLFRRLSDATEAYAARGSDVQLILASPAFFLDLPDQDSFVPIARFVRGGLNTYRQHLIVRADSGMDHLRVLRESGALTVVETTSERQEEILSRAVFGGVIDAAGYFADIRRTPDDFAATADVLYGETSAALVAEFNPLAQSQMGQQLRSLYTSEPLSLPILAVRKEVFTAEALDELVKVLGDLNRDEAGREVLQALSLDLFEILEPGLTISSLIWPEDSPQLQPEIMFPTTDLAPLQPTAPTPDQIELLISVELPSVPLMDPEETPER